MNLTNEVPGYEALAAVLREAYEQAATGKGNERHSRGQPFHEQRIIRVGTEFGIGFNLGQAMKKAAEGMDMAYAGDPERAIREFLGAINYLASTVILLRGKGGGNG